MLNALIVLLSKLPRMSLFYLDEQIVFDEDNYLLYANIAENTEPMRLGAIASSCLAQLLRANGGVVLKRDLMAGAWGQFGLEVTDNSLAQVVRQLRLALAKLQADDELIVTLPRIGYKLADKVQVREASADQPLSSPQIRQSLPIEAAELSLPTLAPEPEPAPAPAPMPEPALVTSRPTATTAPCVAAAQPPAAQTPSATAYWRRALLIALAGALSFALAAAWQKKPLPVDPLVFAAPIELPQLLIYQPLNSPAPSPTELANWTTQIHELAAISQLQADSIHFYLLERRELMGFICDAPLSTAAYCVGVSGHAQIR
jgi:DNA-binding winged helix-turn-helix (wHTH) protein